MTIERTLALALLCLAAAASAAEDAKPGGKRICVPSEDGRSWVCGTPDSPPPERGLPAVRNDGPSPEPPAFLAAPDAGATSAPSVDLSAPPPEPPPPDRFEGSGREMPTTADAAAVAEPEPATPEPLAEEVPAEVTEPTAPEAEPELDIVGADAAEPGTPALIAAPRGQSEYSLTAEPAPAPAESSAPEPEPAAAEPAEPIASEPPATEAVVEEPVVEEPVVEEPVVEEAVVAEPVVEEAVVEEAVVAEPVVEEAVVEEAVVAEPVVAEVPALADDGDSASTAPITADPVPVAPQALTTPPGNTAAFLAQPATHYTLQVARAAAQSGFSGQLAALGLRGEEAWAVPLSGGVATSWMLLWGVFPDLDSARAAAAQLAPRVAAWPRRIAPIQDELRAAGTR